MKENNNNNEYVFNGLYEENKVTKVPKKFEHFVLLVLIWLVGTIALFCAVYLILEHFGLWV